MLLNELRIERSRTDNEGYIAYLIYKISRVMIEHDNNDFDDDADADDLFDAINEITFKFKNKAELDEEQYISHLESVYYALATALEAIVE